MQRSGRFKPAGIVFVNELDPGKKGI